MNKQKIFTTVLRSAGLVSATMAVTGCANQGYSVLASTATMIGVEVSQNPATQMPQGKLGYNRAELAFVPTNRNGGKQSVGSVGAGAADSANVLMELRYGGIFDMGASSGIYQRLAVGTEAVKQPGASVMFAKDADGKINQETAKALAAVKTIPEVKEDLEKKKSPFTDKYNKYKENKDSLMIEKYDNAAKAVNSKFTNYFEFQKDSNLTAENIKTFCQNLISQGENIKCD